MLQSQIYMPAHSAPLALTQSQWVMQIYPLHRTVSMQSQAHITAAAAAGSSLISCQQVFKARPGHLHNDSFSQLVQVLCKRRSLPRGDQPEPFPRRGSYATQTPCGPRSATSGDAVGNVLQPFFSGSAVALSPWCCISYLVHFIKNTLPSTMF